MKPSIQPKLSESRRHRPGRPSLAAAAVIASAALFPAQSKGGDAVDPRIEGVSFSAETGFQFRLHGEPGEYPVEMSSDMNEWTPWKTVRVYHQNIDVPVPESAGMDRLFIRALSGERFETHHLLLSTLSLEARSGAGIFHKGLSWMEAARIDAAGQSLELFGETQFWGSVFTPPGLQFNIGQNREVNALPVTVSSIGMTVEVPGEDRGNEIFPAWQFNFLPVGTPGLTGGVPDLMAGTALSHGQFSDGTLFSAQHAMGFAARKRRDASVGELTGDWGMVRLELLAMDGSLRHRVFTLPTRVTTAHGGSLVSDGALVAAGFLQSLGGLAPAREFFGTVEESFAFPLQVTSEGEVTLPVHPAGEEPPPEGAELILSGFMSPDANFLVMAGSIPREDEPGGWFETDPLAKHLMLGVRREREPVLAGREYRLLGRHSFALGGGFEIGSWDDGTTIRFATATAGEVDLADTFNSVPFANAGGSFVETDSDETNNIPFLYGVGKDGLIEFDLSAVMDEEDEVLMTGYAQEGGRVLIFSFAGSKEIDGPAHEGEVALLIALCTNCD